MRENTALRVYRGSSGLGKSQVSRPGRQGEIRPMKISGTLLIIDLVPEGSRKEFRREMRYKG